MFAEVRMNGLLSAFGSEVFRPIVTLLLPGSIAITPWFVLLRLLFPSFNCVVEANPTETGFAFVGLAILVGFLLEDAGSSTESNWDDQKGEGHLATWNSYLCLRFEREPVGQRYLRTVLLRLKFELGSFWALVVAIPGVLAAGLVLSHGAAWSCGSLVTLGIVLVGCAVLAWMLRKWAYLGHDILHDVRKLLVESASAPTQTQPDPAPPAALYENP